eukprot:c18783_g1_i1.p1 GENE.c18783_g1_i1~~c18783_g1_i1.p1  ORF type:complete len:225 (+),score=66.99 c18783_g1_i1:31-705(+)
MGDFKHRQLVEEENDINESKKSTEVLIKRIDSLFLKITPETREKTKLEIRNELQNLGVVYKSFLVELERLPRDDTRRYEETKKKFALQIKKFGEDLNKMELIERTLNEPVSSQKEVAPSNLSNQQLLDDTHNQYDKTLSAAGEAVTAAYNIERTAINITNELTRQEASLRRTDKTLAEMKDNLHHADRLLRAFVNRMATDQLIMCWLILILLGLVTIMALKMFH